MVKGAARLPRPLVSLSARPRPQVTRPPSPALACTALCRRWWPYGLRPASPLAQWPHVAGGDQPKACCTRANGIPLVARGQVPIVALDHARVGAAIGHATAGIPSAEELPQASSNGSNINEAVSQGAFVSIKTRG